MMKMKAPASSFEVKLKGIHKICWYDREGWGCSKNALSSEFFLKPGEWLWFQHDGWQTILEDDVVDIRRRSEHHAVNRCMVLIWDDAMNNRFRNTHENKQREIYITHYVCSFPIDKKEFVLSLGYMPMGSRVPSVQLDLFHIGVLSKRENILGLI